MKGNNIFVLILGIFRKQESMFFVVYEWKK